LADCEEPEKWLADRLNYLAAKGAPDDWRESGANAHPILARLATMRANLLLADPRESLQEVITSCFLPGRTLRWKQDPEAGRVRMANLEAMLEMARKYEDVCSSGQHAASISGLIIWMQEQAADGQDMKAIPAINAVQVMTNHSAKGLEWPVVILMDLENEIKTRLWSVSAMSNGSIDVNDPLKDRYIHYWPWPFGKSNVTSLDHIDNEPIAKQFTKIARDEEIRLMYVSMTRARDLLILARTKSDTSTGWVGLLDAPWLLPDGDKKSRKDASGEIDITLTRQDMQPLTEGEVIQPPPQDIYWYKENWDGVDRPPLFVSPSSAQPGSFTIKERQRIGSRISLGASADMETVGTAIHGCIAVSFTDPNAPITLDEIRTILENHGVHGVVKPEEVLAQIGEFKKWIDTRWNGARAHAEIPVEALLDNGQILMGRIDLLLETDTGYALIDHKSFPGGEDKWDAKAAEYSGQLEAYKKAVEKAAGKKVNETWLFFPVSAGAVRVEMQ